MQLSWRGVNLLLLCTSTVMFATEGHLIAFTPLQLRELGRREEDIGFWTGVLVAVTMSTAIPLGPFWGVLAERFSRRADPPADLHRAGDLAAGGGLGDRSGLADGGPRHHRAQLRRGRGDLGDPGDGDAAAVSGAGGCDGADGMPIAASVGPPLGALAIPDLGLTACTS